VTDPANGLATKLNQLPKHVVTKTLTEATWNNSSIVRDVAAGVGELKRRYGKELQVHGSAGLSQTLLGRQLVDELNLLVYPIALGQGKRLFEAGVTPSAFKLLESRTTSSGVTILRYALAGKPSYGSFALDA